MGSNPTNDGEELPGHVPRHSTRRTDACNHDAHPSIRLLSQFHLAHSTHQTSTTLSFFVLGHSPQQSLSSYHGRYFSSIIPHNSLQAVYRNEKVHTRELRVSLFCEICHSSDPCTYRTKAYAQPFSHNVTLRLLNG